MKQLIEKAFEESWLNDYYHGNYKGFAQVGFHSGIEWLKSMFPMMYFPPCIMPEDCMENTVSEGEKTIVATTDDYIIFISIRALMLHIGNIGRDAITISGNGK